MQGDLLESASWINANCFLRIFVEKKCGSTPPGKCRRIEGWGVRQDVSWLEIVLTRRTRSACELRVGMGALRPPHQCPPGCRKRLHQVPSAEPKLRHVAVLEVTVFRNAMALVAPGGMLPSSIDGVPS